jgi:hypothetical protein
MIEAKHHKISKIIFDIYLQRLFKKNFYSFYLINEIPKLDLDKPIILAPNHSTWWDGFLAYYLNEIYFKKRFYIMILEESLSRYKFFQKLGGFSINQNSPKAIIKSLDYTINILKNDRNSLFTIFPQGILMPYFIEDYQLAKGLEKIVEKVGNKVNLIFATFNIFYLKEEKPEVFFNFKRVDLSEKFEIENYMDIFKEMIKITKESILNNDKGEMIFNGKKSISEISKNFFGLRRNGNN